MAASAVVILSMLGASCASSSESASDPAAEPISVVATTTIWGDVAGAVVGEDAVVEVLVPIGADVHSFQLSSQQVARIVEADLVVANGLGLEEGMRDALDAARADGANILWVGEQLDPLPFALSDSHDEESHDEESHDEESHDEESHDESDDHAHAGGLDPHVWLDPHRAADAASLIAAELAKVEPSVDWPQRAASYEAALDETDATIVQLLDDLGHSARKMVTNHDAFGYFAARYGFDIIGVVIPGGSTLADPSSAELASLVDVMRAEGVTALFSETTSPAALAEAVAAELGQDVLVVELFSGSLGPDGSGAETLLGMLEVNAERIAAALGS
jgi:zinc/manganese transport system substrate-binding protein